MAAHHTCRIRFKQIPHIVPHRLRVHFQAQPCSLQSSIAHIQVPWIRTHYSSLQDTFVPFFTKVLRNRKGYNQIILSSTINSISISSIVRTFVKIFAPSEYPIAKSGLFGNLLLNHFIVCRTSHVARALYSTELVILLIAQPRELTTHASQPALKTGSKTWRKYISCDPPLRP